MDTRILRQCERSELKGYNSRRVVGLGQLQPVLFSIEGERGPTLRIEGAVNGRACWHVLPLPRYKQQAKRLFAELEDAMRNGVPGAAKAAWEKQPKPTENIMGTRSDIIVHRADGKWHRIYCHWDGYLSHNGKILFDHYTDQKHVDALVALGNLSVLGPKIGKKHPFDKPRSDTPEYAVYEKKYDGMCLAYIRDRGLGNWHYAKTKEEFLKLEGGEIGDTLQAVWPGADCGTEFTYIWDQDKWWVADPDEGTQAMIDLGDALSGKRTLTPNIKAFGLPMVIGKHRPHDPTKPDA